jgi:glutamyl endopeptidase
MFPWRANAALKITVPGKSDLFLATGWFIGPYTLITAAHAVYPREPEGFNGWASQIEVIPGSDGFNQLPPFGKSVSSLFYCPDGWQSDGSPELDYGAVILSEGLGNKVGWFGYATYADNDLLTAIANVAGYPVDAPIAGEPQGREWYSAGAVTSVDDSFMYYNLGTQVGESGSCVYRNIGDQSYAMAIHTYASGMQDRGVRIVEPVYQNLQQWAQMRG